MKTQILQLEAHDDAISTRDKMDWSQTRRIILVWPRWGRILTRRLDLILLQRHALSLGAQLALVTGDPRVRFNAQILGLPVFKTVRQAQSDSWRSPRRRRSRTFRSFPRKELPAIDRTPKKPSIGWLQSPAARLIIFIFGVVSFLAILSLFIPSANITLNPKTDHQSKTFQITASPNFKSIYLSGKIPARLESVVVEGRDSISTTGSIPVPGSFATGRVVFTNLTDQPMAIPQGLIVSTVAISGTDSIRFMTTESGQTQKGLGNFISLSVKAVLPGKSGNLPANSLKAIEGPLGLTLTVINRISTDGGAEGTGPFPDPSDYSILFERLSKNLRNSALDELGSIPSPGSIPISSTLIVTQTIEKAFDPSDTVKDQIVAISSLRLTLRLKFQALVISSLDIQNLAAGFLDSTVPANFLPLPNTLKIINITPVVFNPDINSAVWRVSVDRDIRANIIPDEAARKSVGIPTKKISQVLLASFPLASRPGIQNYPSWWPFMPAYLPRIHVEIHQ